MKNKIKEIFDWIQYVFVETRKRGLLCKKNRIKYLIREYVDADWNIKSIDMEKAESFYQIKCEHYSEIRIHVLPREDRIGEYIPRYLMAVEDVCKNSAQGILDVFLLRSRKSENKNNRLTKIMARNIEIIDDSNVDLWSYVLLHFRNVSFKYLQEYCDRNRNLSFQSDATSKFFLLTPEEEEEAKQKRRVMQLEGTYVCISNRDSMYLSEVYPKKDWHYHNYRDSDIESYKDAWEDFRKSELILTIA